MYFLICSIIAILFLWIRRKLIRSKKCMNYANILTNIQPKDGIRKNLDRVLEFMTQVIAAHLYAFYLYDENQDGYVLQAVRISKEKHTLVAPSYSGLIAYQKEYFNPPFFLPKTMYQESCSLLPIGKVKLIQIPVQGGRGFILIGPQSQASKRLLTYFDGFREPLKKIFEWIEIKDPKNQLRNVNNYALYYGYGKASELAKYDMVIVEPKGMLDSDLHFLHKENTVILSYVSVMEIHPTDPDFPLLSDEDFLYNKVGRIINKAFGTFMVDLRSEKWRSLLWNRIISLIQKGYHGLFLDTIANVENIDLSDTDRTLQLHAAVDIVRRIKNQFPEKILIQNNGLFQLCLLTAPYIDGICWENPHQATNNHCTIFSSINRLEYLKRTYGMRILILIEESEKSAWNQESIYEYVKANHYLIYKAPPQYTVKVYPLINMK